MSLKTRNAMTKKRKNRISNSAFFTKIKTALTARISAESFLVRTCLPIADCFRAMNRFFSWHLQHEAATIEEKIEMPDGSSWSTQDWVSTQNVSNPIRDLGPQPNLNPKYNKRNKKLKGEMSPQYNSFKQKVIFIIPCSIKLHILENYNANNFQCESMDLYSMHCQCK